MAYHRFLLHQPVCDVRGRLGTPNGEVDGNPYGNIIDHYMVGGWGSWHANFKLWPRAIQARRGPTHAETCVTITFTQLKGLNVRCFIFIPGRKAHLPGSEQTKCKQGFRVCLSRLASETTGAALYFLPVVIYLRVRFDHVAVAADSAQCLGYS